MKITIIGTGNIGAGLGRRWATAGHQIIYGVRGSLTPLAKELVTSIGAVACPVADAIHSGEATVLAVPYGAVPDVARAIGDWRGRLVVDCINAIGVGPSLTVGHDSSAAERNAALMPGALLVKSFNAQGAENLANPVYGNVAATNFYCGDDVTAKEIVRQLISDIGFEPLDLGPLSSARFLEPLALVSLAAGRALGSRRVAFQILRDPVLS